MCSNPSSLWAESYSRKVAVCLWRTARPQWFPKYSFIPYFLFFSLLLKTGITTDWHVFNWLSFSFKLCAKKYRRKSPCILIYLKRIDWHSIVTKAVSRENAVLLFSRIKKALTTLSINHALGDISVSRKLLSKVMLAQAILSGINS